MPNTMRMQPTRRLAGFNGGQILSLLRLAVAATLRVVSTNGWAQGPRPGPSQWACKRKKGFRTR